jgi:hypothetical protein
MRKIFIIFLFTMYWLFILSFQRFDAYAALLKSIDSCNLEYEKTSLSGWVRMDGSHREPKDSVQLAEDIYDSIAQSLGYGDGIYNATGGIYTIKGVLYKDSVCVSVSPYIEKESSKHEQTISVDITQFGSTKNIIDIRGRVENCLLKYGNDAHMNVCITGFLKGRADKDASEDIIENILEDIGIKDAECISSENVISAYGYSRAIPDYISCGGKNVNVGIACRYSSNDDRTYFLIGTPVIYSEY